LSDAVAIVVFAIVGLVSHGASAGGFAHDALPLLGGWFAVAAAYPPLRAAVTLARCSSPGRPGSRQARSCGR